MSISPIDEISENKLNHFDDPVGYVISNIEESISVEASAGCGKTYTLISRVCALLRSGRTTIDRLLLLTFTDNAATEMKTRLIDVLKENISERWAVSALEQMHRSSIQTIHSFAYEICSQFHEAVGLPEEISIANSIDISSSTDTFLNRSYDSWGNDPSMLTFFKVANLNSFSRSKFKSALQQLLSQILYVPGDEVEEYLEKKTINIAELDNCILSTSNLKESANSLINLISNHQESEYFLKKQSRVNSFLNLATAIAHAQNSFDIYKLLNNLKVIIGDKKFNIQVGKNASEANTSIENQITELGEYIDSYKQKVTDSFLEFCMELLYEVAIKYRNITFSSGQITFDDTIIGARRALENESIREQIWKKYDSVIVDEFQDTDIHQIAIMEALADDQSEGDLARLFVVGDEKQSIYGFRGATVDGYKSFVRCQPIKRVALDLSRRTVPSVIECINKSSRYLFDDYSPLNGIRDDIISPSEDLKYHVKIIGGALEKNVEDVRKKQANDCIKVLSGMYKNSKVFDKDLNRLCDYSDMAIIIRDRKSLPAITEALEFQAIPYSIDSSALVWELTTTKIILSLLSACSNPRDGYAVIAALKSPIFMINNDALAAYSFWINEQSSNSEIPINNIWDYRNDFVYSQELIPPQNVKEVIDKLSELRNLHNSLLSLDPYSFLHQILFDASLFQSFVAVFGDNHARAVSQFFIGNVISFTDSHPAAGITDYVNYLKLSSKDAIKSDTYIESNEQNKVKILTIHSSKGLEFPIVAFIPSQKPPGDNNVKVIRINEHGKEPHNNFAISITSKKFHSSLINHKDEIKDKFKEEESRLIYVAMTRAQDHLIVSAHHKKSKSQNCQAALAASSLREIDPYNINDAFPNRNVSTNSLDLSRSLDLEQLSLKFDSKYKNQMDRRTKILEAIGKNKTINPTSINLNSEMSSVKKKLSFLNQGSAPRIGRTVHRVLNIINFMADDSTINSLCHICGAKEGIVDKTDFIKCISMVKCALSIPIFNDDFEMIREVPISGYIENVFCEGYIDCLLKKGTEYIIVDYKTDIINSARPLEEKIDLHSLQLAFYSLLLKTNLEVSKCRAVLLFLNHKDRPLIEIKNLEDNENSVKNLISAGNFANDFI